MTTFTGNLDAKRGFEAELFHQHLDAYLDELGLLDECVSALTLFF